MSLKAFISVCFLWFLVGVLFSGLFIGQYFYYAGQKKAYKQLYDVFDDQIQYESIFDRSC